MNVCSLTKNVYDFNILRNDLSVNFDILTITKSRSKKDSSCPVNLHLNNYSVEQRPTETSGGNLLYINKRLYYQLRNDLNLYHPGKIESSFIIEIICLISLNILHFK